MAELNFCELTDEELDQVSSGKNWPAFGKCLLDSGAATIPALAEVVVSTIAKDWAKLAELTQDVAIKALPIVMKCWEAGSIS